MTIEKTTLPETHPICRGCGEPVLPGEEKLIAGVISHNNPDCIAAWFQR